MRRLPVISGSGMERAEACPASTVLPQARSANVHADRGKTIHAFLDAVNKLGADEALARVDDAEVLGYCSALDLVHLPVGASYASEVAFAYNPTTGEARELGRGLERDYQSAGLRDGEIPLTVDVVGFDATNGRVYVGDFKSGRGDVTPAARNLQLGIGAVAAAKVYAATSARVEIIRLHDDGTSWTDAADLDAFDIDVMASRIGAAWRAMLAAGEDLEQGRAPAVQSGPHCRYCPAFFACEAQLSLARALATPDKALQVAGVPSMAVADDRDLAAALTPEVARELYLRASAAQAVLDRVWGALRLAALRQPFEVSPGVVYGPRKTVRENIDGAKARGVLVEFGGAEFADAACTFETSKAAIARALKPIAQQKGAKYAPLERELLERLRKAGAVGQKVTETVTEHKGSIALPPPHGDADAPGGKAA